MVQLGESTIVNIHNITALYNDAFESGASQKHVLLEPRKIIAV